MRRPLCWAALCYVLIAFTLLRLFPLEAEDMSPWEKKNVIACGTIAAKEYKTSSDGSLRLLVALKHVTLKGAEDGGPVPVQHRLLCRMGDGTRESAEALDALHWIGEETAVQGTFRCFRKATNSGEFDLELYYRTLGCSGQLTGAEPAEAGTGKIGTEEISIEEISTEENSIEESDIKESGIKADGMEKPGIKGRGGDSPPAAERLWRIRRRLCGVLEACLSENAAGILKAMLLGDSSTLDPDTKELYQENGIIHILAISGLHISMLGMGLYRMLKKGMGRLCDALEPIRKRKQYRSRRWERAACFLFPAAASILCMWIYGMATGLGASSFRAIVMFSIHLLGDILHRTYDLLTAVCLAGILLLIRQPLYLYNAGFLFSFGAVLGIALLAPAFSTKTMKHLALPLAVLPVNLLFQFSFPVYSLVLNLLVIPLMSVVMAGGLIVLFLGSLWIPAGALAGYIPEWILRFYEGLCLLAQRLPGQQINLGAPAGWQVVFYLGILALLAASPLWEQRATSWLGNRRLFKRMCRVWNRRIHPPIEKEPLTQPVKEKRQRQQAEALRILLAAAGVIVLCLRIQTGLTMHVIDVGQGDGMLLQAEGENFLIDGGSTDKTNVGTYQLLPLLRYYGVREMSCMVTHEDADHINGLLELLENESSGIRVKRLYLPQTAASCKTESYLTLENTAKDREIPIIYLAEGDVLEKGMLRMLCLHPESESAYAEPNERSMALYISYGSFRCLLNGDLEGEGEKRLVTYVREYPELFLAASSRQGSKGSSEDFEIPLTLLHAAHHGSNGATGAEFLALFRPSYAFVSCGEGNRYGHPGQEAMQRLYDAGVQHIFDTRYCGEITFHTDGRRLRVSAYRNP